MSHIESSGIPEETCAPQLPGVYGTGHQPDVVVPALMILPGRPNRWFPRRLDRVLPHVSAEEPAAAWQASPDIARLTEPVPHERNAHRD
jgi:hypothetical protein